MTCPDCEARAKGPWHGEMTDIDLILHHFTADTDSGEIVRRISSGPAKAGSVATYLNGDGYMMVCLKGREYRAHRVMWALAHRKWPSGTIDHINGDKADNRLCNLRDVSMSVNKQNLRKARSDSRSGLIGAIWLEQRKCWKSEIVTGGKKKFIGRFKTAQEAHDAYIKAKRMYHEGCTI